ncbi:MAG: copper resistance protein CopC/CopD [Candidatus Dormibacteraeota bacterium]|nr:copper resistance protein CopC/CopD [Candidatus Dormibacteraeota bacterium]
MLSWPLQASADATVVSAVPRPGANLASAPAFVALEFSEALNRSLSKADVVTPDGRRLLSDPAREQEIVIPVSGYQPGAYRVEWVAVSAVDGHVLGGAFNFGVGIVPRQTGILERASPSPAEVAAAALRWLEYLGLLSTVGIMVVRRLAANPPRIEWVQPSLPLALTVAFTGGLGVIGAEAFDAAGTLPGAITFLTSGPPGWVRVARVAAEGVALMFCLRGVPLVAPAAVFAAAALAFAGHSAGVRPAAGAILTDSLHVLSAGVWAGGIIALAGLRPPGGWRGEEGRSLLSRFGRVALIAFAVTALTGVLRASAELTAVSDLWTTSYGLVLSVKSVGVLAMVVLSSVTWRRRLPFARAEAAIAVAVLAATALLAAYPMPPARAADGAAIRETAAAGWIRSAFDRARA